MSNDQPPAYQPPAYQPGQNQPGQQPGQFYPGHEPQGGEPPIWAPWYGIGFIDAIKRFFKKYADFSGRASRGEYWWWYLAYVIIIAVLYAIFGVVIGVATASSMSADPSGTSGQLSTGTAVVVAIIQGLIGLFALATLVPQLAITWRRLHDAGYSGAYFFFGFIPLAGPIMLLVFTATGPRTEGMRFDVRR